jgi:hypothetical protein
MKHIILLLLLFALCFAGCQRNVQVSGTVTFENGSPVQFGTVVFTSEFSMFQGTIKNGQYDVAMETAGKGVLPGQYKVWLSGTERFEREYGSNGEPLATGTLTFSQVTSEFVNPKTTPFELEITPGTASVKYDIVVKRHPDWDNQQKYKPK